MKWTLGIQLSAVALLVFTGCHRDHSHSEGDSHHGHSHGADGGHSDSAQSFSGATHKADGITLLDETRESLGIQTTEVQEQILPRQIRFTARVFDPGTSSPNEISVTPQASGTVSSNTAAFLQPDLPVEFIAASGISVTGLIQKISRSPGNLDPEIIVALSAPSAALQRGDFGEVTATISGETNALVVPREAVIKGANGNFVYVVNGDASTLTWVELGAEANGFVEITDGLFAGDSVVTRGAMDLWLVELRAVKGGQGCCPAPPQKSKG